MNIIWTERNSDPNRGSTSTVQTLQLWHIFNHSSRVSRLEKAQSDDTSSVCVFESARDWSWRQADTDLRMAKTQEPLCSAQCYQTINKSNFVELMVFEAGRWMGTLGETEKGELTKWPSSWRGGGGVKPEIEGLERMEKEQGGERCIAQWTRAAYFNMTVTQHQVSKSTGPVKTCLFRSASCLLRFLQALTSHMISAQLQEHCQMIMFQPSHSSLMLTTRLVTKKLCEFSTSFWSFALCPGKNIQVMVISFDLSCCGCFEELAGDFLSVILQCCEHSTGWHSKQWQCTGKGLHVQTRLTSLASFWIFKW